MLAAALAACGPSSAPGAQSKPRPREEPARACERGPAPERVEVDVGKTAVTRSGVAVTFETSSHDSYDDGRTDLLLHLRFQGVMDDGSLSPSALRWMPSAFAKPEWVLLGIDRCVRVVEPGERRVVLELFRPERY
jgi:hypothetical protein